MKTSIPASDLSRIAQKLAEANRDFSHRYPGESERRQPVHTFYGGAHLFKKDSARKLGAAALRTLEQYAPAPRVLARALGLPGGEALAEGTRPPTDRNTPAWLAHAVYERVVRKLREEPVEDFRIDFEDGYGNRSDSEEDGHAAAAGEEMAAALNAGSLPPFSGIRVKSFSSELHRRSVRTADIFITTLVEKTGGKLPANFVVTLPKVTLPAQVAVLADVFERLEDRLKLPAGSLKMELMIETPQSIINERGQMSLSPLVEAARGRCVAAHFGTYDYTAGLNITAAYQVMSHPACDFAKLAMQVALAGTGIWLSDGATNVMPVPVHRAAEGTPLSREQEEENRRVIHRAWKLHYDDVRRSLMQGYYQGWDLHPAQLPTRYAAVYAFFLEGLPAASERLRNFVEKAGRATLVGDVFDDAATGQGLLNYFLRALNCGAITEEEALATGLTLEELRLRSFLKVIEKRRGA